MTLAILGGGISGLTAAHYARIADNNIKIILIEASNRLGGWINSNPYEDITLEVGPRTLRTIGNAGANALCLAEELGLSDRIKHVTYNHPASKNRMIYVGGKLYKLPNSLTTALKTMPPFTKPLALQALGDLRKPKITNNDESLYSFVSRRFGPEVARYAIDPLARGVFAGNAKDLSIMSLGKRLHDVEQKHGSVIKGLIKDRKNAAKVDQFLLKSSLVQKSRQEKWAVWSFSGGLTTFVKELENSIKDKIEIMHSSPVTKLEVSNSDNKIIIHTKDQIINCDSLISCIPAKNLSHIIKGIDLNLSNLLSSIPFVSVVVINVVYSGNLITDPGFGHLVPSCETSKVLGVIYDSCVFNHNNKSVFTIMMGGYWYKEYFESSSEQDLLEIALNHLRETLNITADPVHYKVSILKDAIPQYTVGHYERVHNIKSILKNKNLKLYLGGNSYEGIGVNDSILNSRKCVDLLFNN